MADNNEPPAAEEPQPSDEESSAQPEPNAPVNEASASLSNLALSSNANAPAVEDAEGTDEDDPDHEDIRREFMSLLPSAVHPRLEHLKTLHSKRDELLEKYQLERAALELKYADLMQPLYEERMKVVNGEMDGETRNDNAAASDEAGGAGGEGADGQEVKGIPQFWACAMGNMDVIAELISEEDVDCLEFLTDIKCNNFPDGSGFELAFHFAENPYFTNSILTKRYEVPNLLTEDEPILKNVTGTEINWKSGQSLTFKKVTKKQRKKGGRGAGQLRTISKNERQESFFHFFSPPKMPALAEVMDEEEADAVEEAFDHDYDVAQAFRGCVIPKAVLWFTGEAMDEDYGDDLDGFIAGEDETDGGDDGDGQGGGANAFGGTPGQFQFKFDGGAGAGAGAPQPGADGENPECKQS